MKTELANMYRAALPFMLEGHLWRSETFDAFLIWLKSNDRAAEDIRGIIHGYGLQEQAREWVNKRRAIYTDKPDQFNTDRAARLLGAPKINQP
jgi:hypothetical protein